MSALLVPGPLFRVFAGCQFDPGCLGAGEMPITWGGRTILVCRHHAHFLDGLPVPDSRRIEALARHTVLRMQPLVHRPSPPPREPVALQPPEEPRFCSRCEKTRIYACNLGGVCTWCQRRPRATPRYSACTVCGRTYRLWSRSQRDMCKPCTGRFGQHNYWRRKHGFAPLAREDWMVLKRQHVNLRLAARTGASSLQPPASGLAK